MAVAVKIQMFLMSLMYSLQCMALPNGYGMRPGMGWEGDYQDPSAPGPGRGNASYIAAIANFIATAQVDCGNGTKVTPKSLGYWYVNPSSSWDEFNRAPNGSLVPNHLLYPDGIQPTVDHIHSLGLGYGTYSDRGTKDCDRRPGLLGHETQDAEYFAKIGIDWLKSDSCYDSGSSQVAIAHYATMRDALNKTGRKVWYALCGWEPFYASDPKGGNLLANSARIGPDTGSGWQAVLINVDNTKGIGQFAGAHPDGGFWNDGSLQLAPGVGCSGGNETPTCMSRERHRSQFHLWCILGLNLVMTGNLPLIAAQDPYVIETWSNAEAIAINQDAKAWSSSRPGKRLDSGSPLAADTLGHTYTNAHIAECGGEPSLQNWTLANSTIYNPATKTYIAMSDCGSTLIYDSCSFDPKASTCAGIGNYSHFEFTLESSGQFRSVYNSELCITVQTDNALTMTPCSAKLKSQVFNYTQDGQIENGAACITDGVAPPVSRNVSAVFGRPLTSILSPEVGSYAVLFLNDKSEDSSIVCDADCVNEMALSPTFPNTVYMRDLLEHKSLPPVSSIRQGFNVTVSGGGASRLLKLCATEVECNEFLTVQ